MRLSPTGRLRFLLWGVICFLTIFMPFYGQIQAETLAQRKKFDFFTKISIFDQNFVFFQIFDFWPKFRYLSKISIFDLNFDICPKFWFLTKISISIVLWKPWFLKIFMSFFGQIWAETLAERKTWPNVLLKKYSKTHRIHFFCITNIIRCLWENV